MIKNIKIIILSLICFNIHIITWGYSLYNAEISSVIQIVGVISSSNNSIVVLKNTLNGENYFKKINDQIIIEGITLTIVKIYPKKVVFYDGNNLFTLYKDGFIKAQDYFMSYKQNSINNSPNNGEGRLDIPNYNNDIQDNVNDIQDNSEPTPPPGSSFTAKYKIDTETVEMLEEYYRNPQSFSPEQIKELEERLMLSD